MGKSLMPPANQITETLIRAVQTLNTKYGKNMWTIDLPYRNLGKT